MATYNATRDTTLIFTLPYDKGWSAKQNGKPIQIHRIQKGLMGVRVSKGSGTVFNIYSPRLIEGSLIFRWNYSLFPLRMETNKKTKKLRNLTIVNL